MLHAVWGTTMMGIPSLSGTACILQVMLLLHYVWACFVARALSCDDASISSVVSDRWYCVVLQTVNALHYLKENHGVIHRGIQCLVKFSSVVNVGLNSWWNCQFSLLLSFSLWLPWLLHLLSFSVSCWLTL